MQTPIRCSLMRGGTSKGTYFLADDLPASVGTRDAVLLAVMGSPDARQIDGVGGADPLTSKVAIVQRSRRPGIDVDYLFAQVVPDRPRVDTNQNCGNILAGVGPFAIETGLVAAGADETRVAIHMVNSGQSAVATVRTPGGVVDYGGAAAIDGVPGSAAPVVIDFQDTAGASCGALLPTGSACDQVDGIDVTCIDNGMPIVMLRAGDLGLSGHEPCEQLEQNETLKARLESIRRQLGPRMNLDDVSAKTVPKMSLVSAPRHGGHIATRTFIPHRCHPAIGVLGAVSVASGCLVEGSVASPLAVIPDGSIKRISVEHPSGEFSVELETSGAGADIEVLRAGLLRTARLLFQGEVYVPHSVWDGGGEHLDELRVE